MLSSRPLSGSAPFDERAVSTTLGYALTLGITTLLVSGLLIVGGTFIQDQREQATQTEYRVVGQRLAADIGAADRLLATAGQGGSVTVERSLPDKVVGENYRVGISRIGDGDRYRIRLRNDKESVDVTVQVRSEAVVYDSGELAGDRIVVDGNGFVDDKLLISPEGENFSYPAADRNTVVVEAEAPTDITAGSGSAAGHRWESFYDPDASGNTAIWALPNSSVNVYDSTDGPRLDYPIQVPESGDYCLYVRMKTPSGNDDSVHVGVDENEPVTYDQDGDDDTLGLTEGTSNSWGWISGTSDVSHVEFSSLSAGTHTLNLYMREDGTQVDKIVLAKRSSCSGYTPSGEGPEVG